MFRFPDLPDAVDLNFNEICRLCRTSKGVMSYIFSSSGVDTSLPLATRIMNFANIRMSEGDGLPSLICHRCLYHIEKANEFKLLCEQSDALLRHYVMSQLLLHSNNENRFSREEKVLDENSDESEGFPKKEMLGNGDIHENHLENRMDDSEDQNSSDMEEPGDFNCPNCNKNFETEEALSRHLLIHSQDGPFPCDYCSETLKDKASLKVHWRQEHSANKPHMCQTCGQSFSHRESLITHNVRHDLVKPYHCSECSKAFAYRSDLKKHSVIHTGVRPYVCPICFKSFTRSTNLNKHARLHTGRRPFSCGGCDKMFASRADLVRHSVIHTGEKPYSCNICSISFNRKDKLSRHEKLHQGDRAHACSECPTSFHRKEELTKHIQFHHYSPEMPTSDEIDGLSEESATPINFPEDVSDLVHSSDLENDLKQDTQFMKASSEYRMQGQPPDETEDMVINVDPSHWEEAKSQCDICLKIFGDPNELAKHRVSHNKSRDFVCDVCNKGFHQRRELIRHSVTHTGYKPHTCEICGKAFSRRDKLTRHSRTHMDLPQVKEFKELPRCHICSKHYSSKHELSRHLLTHSLYKPFQCSICTAAYCRKDKLAKHIKMSHPEPLSSIL